VQNWRASSPTTLPNCWDHFGITKRITFGSVNQIARALNAAMHTGEYPPYQGEAVREAGELVRSEMRRAVAVMSGNWDYWGLPWADRPMPAPGAEEREDERTRAEAARRRLRPRYQPKRFLDSEGKDRDRQAMTGQGEAGSLGDAGKEALAEVMRRYDEGQRAQRAEAETHARKVLSQREQAGVPLPPEPAQGQVQVQP